MITKDKISSWEWREDGLEICHTVGSPIEVLEVELRLLLTKDTKMLDLVLSGNSGVCIDGYLYQKK